MASFSRCAIFIALFIRNAEASAFLKARPTLERTVAKDLVEETLSFALKMSGENLRDIEDELRPMYTSLPKTGHGTLEPDVVHYALNRYFVKKHGWYMKAPEANGAMDAASPVKLFKDRVPGYIQGRLEQELHGKGWGLHELSVSVAALSELLRREHIDDLKWVYDMLEFDSTGNLDQEQVSKLVNAYILQYILEENSKFQTYVEMLKEVVDTYPGWYDFSMWAQDLVLTLKHTESSRHNPFVTGLTFDHVSEIVEEIAHRYGSFQTLECSSLKNVLIGVEHNGTGRVPLAEFYRIGLQGVWRFWETVPYLRHIGALDERIPSKPALIIPNFVSGRSNCVASSNIFSVCCQDECMQLMNSLEQILGAPFALPSRIAAVVSRLESDTVEAPRNLSQPLLSRLEEIATRHQGQVPLHSRLFSQWMHWAYPHECPYPQVGAVANPLTPEAWAERVGQSALSDVELSARIAEFQSKAYDELDVMPWTNEEEMIGYHEESGIRWSSMRQLMAFMAVASFAMPLYKASKSALGKDSKASLKPSGTSYV